MLPNVGTLTPEAFVAHWHSLRALRHAAILDLERLVVRLDRPFDPDALPGDLLACLSKRQVKEAARFDMRRRWEVVIRAQRVADRICAELELDRLLLNLPAHLRSFPIGILPLRFVGRPHSLRFWGVHLPDVCPVHARSHGLWTLGELADDYAAGLDLLEVRIVYVGSGRTRRFQHGAPTDGAVCLDNLFEALAIDLPLGTAINHDLERLKLRPLMPDVNAPWMWEAVWE